MSLRRLLASVLLIFTIQVNAQLNVNLAYNNRSILYEGAQGLHGIGFQALYKNKSGTLNGLELCFNQGRGYRYFPVILAKKPKDVNYGKVPYTEPFQAQDTTLEYKQFQGKRAYVYFSFSIQHFELLNSSKNRRHYLGLNVGFNLLAERMLVKNENVNGKYFDNHASLFQVMLGVGYQRELMLNTSLSFVYGLNLSLSAMPFRIRDFEGISTPLATASGYLGLRWYFK